MAVKLALDTNRYADLCRGNARATEIVEAADAIWLPFVVVGELRAGFAAGSQGPRNEAVLRRFLLKPGVGIDDFLRSCQVDLLFQGELEKLKRLSPAKCQAGDQDIGIGSDLKHSPTALSIFAPHLSHEPWHIRLPDSPGASPLLRFLCEPLQPLRL